MQVSVCHVRQVQDAIFGRALELLQAVSAGDAIACEAPFITVALDQMRSASKAGSVYAKLSAKQKEFVSSLSPPGDGASLSDQASTAAEQHFCRAMAAFAHPLGGGGGVGESTEQALFLNISLAPHSCDSNAAYCSTRGFGRLYALHDLAAGDLVTVCHIPSVYMRYVPFWKRQALLSQNRGFICRCERCQNDLQAGCLKAPSSESKRLLNAKHELDTACADGSSSLKDVQPLFERHILECESASWNDDGPFHLFNVLDLLFECHMSLFLRRGNVEYLVSALSSFARKCERLPCDENLLQEVRLDALFYFGSQVMKAEKGALSRVVLRRLWKRLGALLRDRLGASDPDYESFCDVFEGQPNEERPCVEDVVKELKSVHICSLSSCRAAFVRTCADSSADYCESCARSGRHIFLGVAGAVIVVAVLVYQVLLSDVVGGAMDAIETSFLSCLGLSSNQTTEDLGHVLAEGGLNLTAQ
eukprot:gnl/TRDRNA2_/TRDRNA2_165885_c0_seq2.p1 gnl/TRDRNA2_/TRDRNA2_165885_c0~~gnl/TRDRNA2_/TRDRNA2_165885_c0_seq2.p1  ORF type:complete len:475 (-),score=72.83 gnl/TRDRNA2_/TRDRNA2_165885_c0_seq2:95-1519(-)